MRRKKVRIHVKKINKSVDLTEFLQKGKRLRKWLALISYAFFLPLLHLTLVGAK